MHSLKIVRVISCKNHSSTNSILAHKQALDHNDIISSLVKAIRVGVPFHLFLISESRSIIITYLKILLLLVRHTAEAHMLGTSHVMFMSFKLITFVQAIMYTFTHTISD